ncbi:hypothetical protein Tco_0689952 [Tanacetum coccineum]
MITSCDDTINGDRELTNSRMIITSELKINDEFLKILQDNTFNGMDGGDVIVHIAKVLEITEWIKMPNMEKNELRLHVFSKSLCGAAKTWWNNEINETTITWGDLNGKNFHQYYPLSHIARTKSLMTWTTERITLNLYVCWRQNSTTIGRLTKIPKMGFGEFYMNECAKGTIDDLDKYKEPCKENTKKTFSDTFYKPYLGAQEAKDIYEVINREYSPIPILARRDIDNPNELYRTEEFTVIRHSIGNDEEFVTVGPSKINTIERTPGSMSCIYHELFNRKDRGWEVTRTR